jgi:hypothetical protein
VDRVAEQPDRASQDRQQKFHDAGRRQPDRTDRDRAIGVPAFLHVIACIRQRKGGGRVTHPCALVHPASLASYPPARQICPVIVFPQRPTTSHLVGFAR